MRVGGESGNDGTIDVVTLQIMHRHNLPGVVTQLHRGDLCVRREETWSRAHRRHHDGVHPGIDPRLSGERCRVPPCSLPTASGGARLDVQLTVHVRIPLIGGKLEKLIGAQLATWWPRNNASPRCGSIAAPKLAPMRIALAQILSGTDPAANLELVRDYTGQAADAGAKLVVFPEATMCRFGVPLAPIAEPVDGPWADGVRRIATDAGITVIAGMFTPAGDGRVTNTLIAAGPGSPNRPDDHYDKIHLYDAFGFTESRTVAPGTRTGRHHGRRRPGGADRLLRHSLSSALHRAGPPRRPADRRLRILGFGPRQTRAVDAAGPRPCAGLDELRRSRPVRPTPAHRGLDRRGFGLGRADRGGRQPGGLTAGRGGRCRPGPAHPQLVVADIDIDRVEPARESIAVLRNRSSFAQLDRAESLG